MAKLDPKYIGKIPPDCRENLTRNLKEYRKSAKDGIISGIEIHPGPGCSIAKEQEGMVYDVNNVPKLPLPGCKRSPCCACCYLPVVNEKSKPEKRKESGMSFRNLLIYSGVIVAVIIVGAATSKKDKAINRATDPVAVITSPKIFPIMEKFHWKKGGFDNVIIAEFTLSNRSETTWKDVMISCDGNAKSGTRLGTNTSVVYEKLTPGETKKIKGFNVGIINSQTAEIGCEVVNAVEVKI